MNVRKYNVDPETGERLLPDLDENGSEILDPTPEAPPVGYNPQPTMWEQVRMMIESQKLAEEAAAAGFETLEESDDFDVGDDYDPHTPYENESDVPFSELLAAGKAEKDKKEEAARRAPPAKTVPTEEPLAPAPKPE